MLELPLSQRVAKTARKGWSCLFIGMHLALKGWFERKSSVSIWRGMVGLQAPGC